MDILTNIKIRFSDNHLILTKEFTNVDVVFDSEDGVQLEQQSSREETETAYLPDAKL